MKYLFFLCFLLLGANHMHSQISKSDLKKIRKVFGENFVRLNPEFRYPSGFHPEVTGVESVKNSNGDTTAYVFNDEYIRFRNSSLDDKASIVLVKAGVVSVSEYQEFKNYVRDSIARLNLILRLSSDSEGVRFLKLDRKAGGSYRIIEEFRSHDPPTRSCYYQLDWNRKLSYSDPYYVSCLSDLYLPRNERFRKKRVFDERKLRYQYYELPSSVLKSNNGLSQCEYIKMSAENKAILSFNTSVANDITLWAVNASHNDSELGVLSQLYTEINRMNPVVGVLGTQSEAFCNWKQRELQRELNKKGVPYKVRVNLPSEYQLSNLSAPRTMEIPSHDFSDQWRIAQSDYAEFTEYVKDSILREIIYQYIIDDEDAIEYINYTQRYFDEGALEFVDFDRSDRDVNRELFTLNFDTKIRQEFLVESDVSSIVTELNSDTRHLVYRYSTIQTIDKSTCSKCKEVIPGRSNLNNYIQEHVVSLKLDNSNSAIIDPNSLIPSLTYEQAMAYYNWKYPIDKFNPKKDNWQQFVYPSEEQFRKIQNGESIITESRDVDFPTPLFRYVVHIYPKEIR